MRTLIYSNLFIALCAAILTLGTYGVFELTPHPHLVLHIFGVTLVAYNVQRLIRLRKFSNRTEQIQWYLRNKWMLYTALFIGLTLSGFTFFALPFKKLLIFSPLALLSFFYSVPVIPSAGGRMAIRALPGVKIFMIALVWTGVTLILPIYIDGRPIDAEIGLAVIQRLLFMIAITIPFDMRDLKYDHESLKTLPQLLGYERSRKLGIMLLAICVGISFLMMAQGWISWPIAIKSSGVYIIALVLVLRLKQEVSDRYFTLLLDGTMLLLGLALMFN